MEAPLLPTGSAMAWRHSQCTAVGSVSQAGRRVLGTILNCSEATGLEKPFEAKGAALDPTRAPVVCGARFDDILYVAAPRTRHGSPY